MSRSRRLTSLFVAVVGVAALLLVTSRWVGRAGGPAAGDDDGPARGGVPEPAQAGASSSSFTAPDLSFYKTLGAERASPGSTTLDAARDRTAPLEAGPRGAAAVYVVQVIATRDAAQARRVRDRLAARGLPAVVSEGRAGAQPIYRVRVGRYSDRPAAEAVIRRLRGERGLSPWILREAR